LLDGLSQSVGGSSFQNSGYMQHMTTLLGIFVVILQLEHRFKKALFFHQLSELIERFHVFSKHLRRSIPNAIKQNFKAFAIHGAW
jgi:hypothetical protein